MATRIERLQASLKKEREKQDIRKLNDIHDRIKAADIIQCSHNFHSRRLEIIERLNSLINETFGCIQEAIAIKEDSPATGGE